MDTNTTNNELEQLIKRKNDLEEKLSLVKNSTYNELNEVNKKIKEFYNNGNILHGTEWYFKFDGNDNFTLETNIEKVKHLYDVYSKDSMFRHNSFIVNGYELIVNDDDAACGSCAKLILYGKGGSDMDLSFDDIVEFVINNKLVVVTENLDDDLIIMQSKVCDLIKAKRKFSEFNETYNKNGKG